MRPTAVTTTYGGLEELRDIRRWAVFYNAKRRSLAQMQPTYVQTEEKARH